MKLWFSSPVPRRNLTGLLKLLSWLEDKVTLKVTSAGLVLPPLLFPPDLLTLFVYSTPLWLCYSSWSTVTSGVAAPGEIPDNVHSGSKTQTNALSCCCLRVKCGYSAHLGIVTSILPSTFIIASLAESSYYFLSKQSTWICLPTQAKKWQTPSDLGQGAITGRNWGKREADQREQTKRSWASDLSNLCLSFLKFKTEIIIVSTK